MHQAKQESIEVSIKLLLRKQLEADEYLARKSSGLGSFRQAV